MEQRDMVTSRHPSSVPDSSVPTGASSMTIKLAGKDRQVLIESISRDLESIDDACRRGDQAGFLECIHSLKGALFIVGEHTAANDCGAVEQSIQAQGLDSCGRDIERLKVSLRRLLERYAKDD